MLINIALFTFLCISHYSAGNCTSYLAAKHLTAVSCLYQRISTLILLTGLRQPCLMIIAITMIYSQHLSFHRKPVGMYIEKTHKNGYHQSFLMKVLILFHFLYHHHFTISRSNHITGRVTIEVTDGATIKVKYNSINKTEYYRENPKR